MGNSDELIDKETRDDFVNSLGIEKFKTYNDMYFKKMDTELPNLMSLIDSKDFASIKKLSHSIKGLSYNLGYSYIGEKLETIEKCSKNETEIPEDLVKEVLNAYERMKSLDL
ncbi:MAG: Hpt domain-containing protein [Leptospiraceae bacterium]|nr:Hpt domain-containing protein [Leptospiraceae bacterium]MCP5510868.1 Hpt domain-containing protein [Leptospiraceae bacterium]